jgi:uncharacterized membrane protein YqgA involved in biofilm formation
MKIKWKEDLVRAFVIVGIFTILCTLWQIIDLVSDKVADLFFCALLTYCIYYIIYKKKDE